MTDRKLRSELLKKLNVSKQRLSQLVNGVKQRTPMSTEDATYCIAHQNGMKLDKYLKPEVVAHIRGLLAHLSEPTASTATHARIPKTVIKTREVKVGGGISINDPVLSETAIRDASDMANKVYPILYVFENSVREVIQRIMKAKFGAEWWEQGNILKGIRTTVQSRKDKEDSEAWHGRRGAHQIHYTDVGHLVQIVRDNWELFKKILPRQEWLSNLVECMEMSRNPVAHMNPIHKDDIERVRINFRDWQKQIESKRALLN